MIAAISPATVNFEESLSTLRYANQVKAIKNKAKINESPQDRLIRELREQNDQLKKMLEQKQFINDDADDNNQGALDKAHLMNINEDPLLTGQIKHLFKDGINKVGKPKKGKKPDIAVGGLGVVPQHSQISFDDSSRSLVLHPNAEDPGKNKTYLNGELINSDMKLEHGDKVLFGNHNLFIVIFPGQEVPNDWLDYQLAMQNILSDQMAQLRDDKYEKEMEDKLKRMKDQMEKDKNKTEGDIKLQNEEMEKRRKEMEDDLKKRDEEINRQLKMAGDNDGKFKELEEKLKMQKEEAERLRKEQKDKEQAFLEEKNRALKAMEEANKKRKEEEFELMMRKELEI